MTQVQGWLIIMWLTIISFQLIDKRTDQPERFKEKTMTNEAENRDSAKARSAGRSHRESLLLDEVIKAWEMSADYYENQASTLETDTVEWVIAHNEYICIEDLVRRLKLARAEIE